MIPIETRRVDLSDWTSTVLGLAKRQDWRYGHMTARREADDARLLEVLLLHPPTGSAEIVSARIPQRECEFPSITSGLPAAHWAERAIGDYWGLLATDHPRWKSLILHQELELYEPPFAIPGDARTVHKESPFMTVGGEGVHEIPVGPIHASIIEPGHFRFSCLGEVIANLEIRLGYQHRGIEARLAGMPWRQARHVVESCSSDSTVAYALAHATAIENLLSLVVTGRAAGVRTLALEIERVANHLGDLGALASDVGFALGAAIFGRLRGAALGLGQSLSGTRFQKGFVCPGGLAWDVDRDKVGELTQGLAALKPQMEEACKLVFENPGFEERLEGVGVLNPSLASEFGLVGPAARASGGGYDARKHFEHALYPAQPVDIAGPLVGDALSRALARRQELSASWKVMEAVLADMPTGPALVPVPELLPPSQVGIGIVEAWRGELIHWVTTGPAGEISRYSIRDPSFQNWTGVSIAVRKNLVMDFPLINKSFNLSYSGNDL